MHICKKSITRNKATSDETNLVLYSSEEAMATAPSEDKVQLSTTWPSHLSALVPLNERQRGSSYHHLSMNLSAEQRSYPNFPAQSRLAGEGVMNEHTVT